MKTITIKPLRYHKKSKKIMVAAYMQWRQLKIRDYEKFKLVINEDYKLFPKDAYVYDHKGKQLFFPKYQPDNIPNRHVICIDCDGVPAFSHYTADYIATQYNSDEALLSFYPLTVEMVTTWFGWLLYQSNNAQLS